LSSLSPTKKRSSLSYGPFLLKRVCRIYLPYLGALVLAITLFVTEIFYLLIEHPAILLGRRVTATRKSLPKTGTVIYSIRSIHVNCLAISPP
jgi:peptidoglycan/LPS O-acetylase OafA/YrhL